MRGRGRRGLTLAEVVLAIGLIAIAGLGVLAVFTKLLGSQSKTSHQAVGRYLADMVLEEAVLAGPNNWGMADISQPETTSIFVQDAETQATYTHRVLPIVLRTSPPDSPMGTLYLVEVEVSWWSDDFNESQAGVGSTTTTASRAVYIEE